VWVYVQCGGVKAVTEGVAEAAPEDDAALEQLWRSVDSELVRIGKTGVGAGHVSSLRELVVHHPQGVKVKVNHSSVDLNEVVAKLTDGTGAKHLMTKGRTLLFEKE
jgi:RNA-binding protein YhbY